MKRRLSDAELAVALENEDYISILAEVLLRVLEKKERSDE